MHSRYVSSRLSVAAPFALVAVALTFLPGCNPTPGPLVPEPPLPPAPQDQAAALPVFRPAPLPPGRQTAAVARQQPASAPADKSAEITPPSSLWNADNPQRWKHIVLHHSASDFGNSESFDRLHRARKWDELGYHFVITNGLGGSDGHVEVGPRWIKQKHGAHCRVDPNDDNYWNEHGIGICLVGDFNKRRPSHAQLESAARLVAWLMQQCDVPPANVLGHGQVTGARTECPGKLFPYADLMKRVQAQSPTVAAAR